MYVCHAAQCETVLFHVADKKKNAPGHRRRIEAKVEVEMGVGGGEEEEKEHH
jgi:hypothetical protein